MPRDRRHGHDTQPPPPPGVLSQVDPMVFNAVVRGFHTVVAAAHRHRTTGPDNDTALGIHLAVQAASCGTADGRWLLARMLVDYYLQLLAGSGLCRRRDVEAFVAGLAKPPADAVPHMMARYEQSMTGASHFLHVSYERDIAGQKQLTRDPEDDLLYTLVGLVACMFARPRR